ncbi:MAG: hypothetical protein K6T83_20435 [Alicyclobacillus sp.]|nr:hypothetical protein [Alicyclobacillus sp.]
MTLHIKAWTPAELAEAVDHWDAFRPEWWQEQVRLLLRQIEDRDKKIAEKTAEFQQLWRVWAELEQQNALMLEALEVARQLHETINTFWLGDCNKVTVIKAQSRLCDTLAKVRDEKGATPDARPTPL